MMFYGIPAEPAPEEPDAAEGEQLALPVPEPTELDLIMRDPVLTWRCSQLVKAGLTIPQARKLALDNRVDLHYVVYRLIGRGCDPSVAFDIASA